ncbi:MAG: hypothetical protein GY940_30665 [bacterium]|nr:hypothetical protein [bacterium]
MDQLKTKFNETESKWKSLKDRLTAGEITPEQAQDENKRLMVQDDTGSYWMLGVKTGQWYKHENGAWKENDPYESLGLLTEQEPEPEPESEPASEPQQQEESPYALESHHIDDSAVQQEGEAETGQVAGLDSGRYEEAGEEDVFTLSQQQEAEGQVADEAAMGEDSGTNIDMKMLDTNQFGLSTDRETQGIRIDLEAEEQKDGQEQEPQEQEALFTSESSFESRETQQEFGEVQASGFDDSAQPAQQEQTFQEEQPMQMDTYAATQDAPQEQHAPVGPETKPSPLDTSHFVHCVVCDSKIPPIAVYCSFCGANQRELGFKKGGKKKKAKQAQTADIGSELVIKSIRITSFLFFLGGLGIIAGVLVGATFGVLKDFLAGLHDMLPIMLQETRGGFTGGLIFAAIGGIGGFIGGALLSIVLSGIYNLVAYVFGGIRFKIKG